MSLLITALQNVSRRALTVEEGHALISHASRLARNEVPLYSATFVDDMYVDFGLAQETARLVKNCKQYITNSMYHDAIRRKTNEILEALFSLKEDSID